MRGVGRLLLGSKELKVMFAGLPKCSSIKPVMVYTEGRVAW